LNRPFVCLVSEISVDGKLTLAKGVSSRIFMTLMDHESEIFLHKLRSENDAIIVGSNTIKIDNSNLTVRYVEGKNPLRVVPCSNAKLPLDSNILNHDAPTLIAVSAKADSEDVDALKSKGAEVVVCGKGDAVDLVQLVEELRRRGVKKLIVEGGPTLAYSMLRQKLLDEIKLIHIPVIVGGVDTPSLIWGKAASTLEEVVHTKLTKHYLCGKHLITEYTITY
jgi:2,5-diamino-6-(ribosylamino)-4(3H)-pyrimidinone 5'-phosphate reductase